MMNQNLNMNYKKRKKLAKLALWVGCPVFALGCLLLLILDTNNHAYESCADSQIIILTALVAIPMAVWVVESWVDEKERQEKSEKPVEGPRMSDDEARLHPKKDR